MEAKLRYKLKGERKIDNENKIVTTPAYMNAESISEAAKGIEKLVDQVVSMAK